MIKDILAWAAKALPLPVAVGLLAMFWDHFDALDPKHDEKLLGQGMLAFGVTVGVSELVKVWLRRRRAKSTDTAAPPSGESL